MASELKVDKFTGVTTAGSISVTGEGNSTTTNLQQGLCKFWMAVSSNHGSLDDSFNCGRNPPSLSVLEPYPKQSGFKIIRPASG